MTTYGDIRDTLVALPHHPWPDHANGAHYVTSDIFPAKHGLLAAEDWEGSSGIILEIGAYVGYFLVTAAVAMGRDLHTIAWVDNESQLPGSNALVAENLAAAIGGELAGDAGGAPFIRCFDLNASHPYLRRFRSLREVAERHIAWDDWQADVVHIDGDHSYAACLTDLGFALSLSPRLILVDDYQAIGEVRSATDDFARYVGLEVEEHTTVNGFAVIRP